MKYPISNYLTVKRGLKFKQPYPAGFGALTGKPHLGEDLIIPVGTPIYCPIKGKAKLVQTAEQGYAVHLLGSDGHLWRFMHLFQQRAKDEDTVYENDLLGLSGNSGVSSNPHLHIDVSKGLTFIPNINNFINPYDYLIKNVLSLNESQLMTIIRNQKTGEFSYIQDGKRRKITQDRSGLAMLTVWTKGLVAKDEYKNMTEAEYNAIPQGADF